MKKFIFLFIFLCNLLHSEEQTIDPQYIPINTQEVVNFFNDKNKRWLMVGTGNLSLVFFDTKTAQYNKNTKTVKGWFKYMITPSGRLEYIKRARNGGYYNSYWHEDLVAKILFEEFNLTNNKVRVLSVTDYDSNDNNIYSYEDDKPNWEEIVPDSVSEQILDELKKRYR